MARKSRYDLFDQLKEMCESEGSRIGLLCDFPLWLIRSGKEYSGYERVWQVVYLRSGEWHPIESGTYSDFGSYEGYTKAAFEDASLAGQVDFEVLAQDQSLFVAIHRAMELLRKYGNLALALDSIETDEISRQSEMIYERDNHVCVYCGAHATHIDHIVAKADGGEDVPSNKVAACQPCNNSKSDAFWSLWYRAQRFYFPERERYIEGVMKGEGNVGTL